MRFLYVRVQYMFTVVEAEDRAAAEERLNNDEPGRRWSVYEADVIAPVQEGRTPTLKDAEFLFATDPLETHSHWETHHYTEE